MIPSAPVLTLDADPASAPEIFFRRHTTPPSERAPGSFTLLQDEWLQGTGVRTGGVDDGAEGTIAFR
jgi:hypothetical protein